MVHTHKLHLDGVALLPFYHLSYLKYGPLTEDTQESQLMISNKWGWSFRLPALV